MNLLILDHSDDFYGGQKSLEGFLDLINKERMDIGIICFFNKLNYKWPNALKSKNGITAFYLNYNFLNPLVYIFFLYKSYVTIRRNNINIVHANTFKSAIAILPIKLFVKSKFVFRARLGIDYNSHGVIDYLIFKFYDKIICNSNYVANSFKKKYSMINSENKLAVIFNGLGENIIETLSSKKLNERLVLANIGRFEKIKNQQDLIFATKILKDQGYNIEVRLYGSQSKLDNGNYFNYLNSILKNLDLHGIVKVCNYEENISNIYNELRIVVVTSKSEALSRVCFESFFSGIPVIASDIEGNKEIINHQENGFLYELGNPEDLADKILFLIKESNKAKVQDVIASAYRYAMDNFRASKNYYSEILLLEKYIYESRKEL